MIKFINDFKYRIVKEYSRNLIVIVLPHKDTYTLRKCHFICSQT